MDIKEIDEAVNWSVRKLEKCRNRSFVKGVSSCVQVAYGE